MAPESDLPGRGLAGGQKDSATAGGGTGVDGLLSRRQRIVRFLAGCAEISDVEDSFLGLSLRRSAQSDDDRQEVLKQSTHRHFSLFLWNVPQFCCSRRISIKHLFD